MAPPTNQAPASRPPPPAPSEPASPARPGRETSQRGMQRPSPATSTPSQHPPQLLPYPTSTLPPPARLLHSPSASRFVPFFACFYCAVALNTLVSTNSSSVDIAPIHYCRPAPPLSPRRLVVIVARYFVCHRPPVVWCSPRIRARSTHILPILPILPIA